MSPARLPSRTAGAFMNGSARDVRGAFCTTATSSGNSSTAPSAPGMAGADHSSVSALASWARRVDRSTLGAKASAEPAAARAMAAMVWGRGIALVLMMLFAVVEIVFGARATSFESRFFFSFSK